MTTALLLVSLAVHARALEVPKLAPNDASAAAELKAALEAHMDGDDAKARRRLAACVKKAAPDSPDESGCKIYLEWWAEGAKQEDKPSPPEARRLYRRGVAAYKKGDFAGASAAWHDCLDAGATGTAVTHDCLAMIDLVPKAPAMSERETKAREAYMRGFAAYGSGDKARAYAAWSACAADAPKDTSTAADCLAGLKKLDGEKPEPKP